MTVPAPLACDGVTAHDPVSRSVLVKVSGFGASFWRRGHQRMVELVEAGRYWDVPTVYASAAGRGEVARGEAVRDGWLRFKLSDADYRQLVGRGVIVTVDTGSSTILGVRFRNRS